ncbi:MAG: DEAD/DEAH box helicase [Candidatus Micrarchaeia archaeon]
MDENSVYLYFLSKFQGFTEIQKLAIPAVEKGENCLITAPTGTGKTEAAVLPILENMRKMKGDGIETIYITPLRSLNRDLVKRLEEICKRFEISIGIRHGDTTQKERSLQVKNPPRFLITTPETLQNILITKSFRKSLKNVRYVIVDELHELYHTKRGAQLSIALERLVEIAGEFQRIGISATVGDLEEASSFLFGKRPYNILESKAKKEVAIEVEMPKAPLLNFKELKEKFSLDKESIARIERIISLIKEYKKSILFVNTRQVAESLGSKIIYLSKMYNFGEVAIHHSSLDKEERIRVEESFKKGLIKSIIATSSLELGIDIGDVELVMQYGSPKQATRLLQRVGRSGHGVEGRAEGKVIVGSIIDALESGTISRLALEKKLEKNKVEDAPADVLANQIAAISLEYNEIEEERLYNIITRARPFSNMKKEVFDRTLKMLDEHRIIRRRPGMVLRGSKTLKYFIENISVIPDVSKFVVKNVVTNKIISALDERFVANYVDEGSDFIAKGLPWHVVSIDKGVIYVEPSTSLEAAIPDWEGEDIPVSPEVAKGVERLLESEERENNMLMLASIFSKELGLEAKHFFEEQRKYFKIRSNSIPVELFEDYIIIYTFLGRLANEFLGKIVGSIFTADAGNVSVRVTPYAIILDASLSRRKPNAKRDLEILREYNIEDFIEKSEIITKSELFRYKFVQVAKLFGIIEKGATVTRNVADRLIHFYKGSVLYEEVVRDLYKNYYDAARVEEFLKRLRKGELNFEFYSFGELSPLSNELLKSSYYYKELLLPVSPGGRELQEFIEGMEGKKIDLLCTFCGFRFSKNLGEVEEGEKIVCPACGSSMISIYKNEFLTPIEKAKKGEKLSEKERLYYKESLVGADLISEYGKRALVALSTYGIGVKTAARILKMLRKDYKHFLIDLIEAQKNYIKYKKFWKEE